MRHQDEFPTWHLDRIFSLDRPLDLLYIYYVQTAILKTMPLSDKLIMLLGFFIDPFYLTCDGLCSVSPTLLEVLGSIHVQSIEAKQTLK